MSYVQYQQKPRSNVFLDAYELMLEIENDKKVKIVDWAVPQAQDFIIYDISIDSKGNDEDKIYLMNEKYRKNIRRGNTIIQELDANKTGKQTFWGRKGAEKFFDLNREYIMQNLGQIKEIGQAGIKSQSENREAMSIIFNDISKAIENKQQIQVFKMIKENGENAQISFVETLNSWIIASKNVSLIAKDLNDLNAYTQQRFQFARLIAIQWFKILAQLQQKFGKDILPQLQQKLKGYTLVGEYCGDQNHQHLVKYDTIDIRFFNIVDKFSENTCISPLEAEEIFSQYKLSYVKPVNVGTFNDWKSLNEALLKLYDQTETASIEEGQEGLVLYFMKLNKNKENNKVLSLCKMKTLEYRIYRKLREKLKTFISKNKNKNEQYSNFVNETQDLCRFNQPSKNIEYYYKIAQTSFDFVANNPQHSKIIPEIYISFLSLVINCLANNQPINPNNDLANQYLEEIRKISWQTQYQAYLNQMQKQLKIQQQEEQKSVQNQQQQQKQNQQIQQPKENILVNKNNNNDIINKEKKNDIPNQQLQQSVLKMITVFVPIGIPGMGKTQLVNILKEQYQDVFIISSDEIRKFEMEYLMKNDQKLTKFQAFENSKKAAKQNFNGNLEQLIKSNISKQSKSEHAFLFIDKNHPPNAIESTINNLKKFNNNKYQLNIVALIPQCEKLYQINQQIQFPFSLNFFFSCLQRVQSRKDHPTLNGNGSQSCDVVIKFFKLFQNEKLDNNYLMQEYGFNQVFQFSFTNESQEQQIQQNQDLINKLNSVLISNQPSSILVEAFIKLFEKQVSKMKEVDIQQQKQRVKQIIEQCLVKQNQQIYNKSVENQKQEQVKKNQNEEIKKQDIPSSNSQQQQFQQNTNPQAITGGYLLENLMNQIQPAKGEFNPSEAPIYMGIFVKDQKQAEQRIEDYIKTNLLKLKTELQEMPDKIQEDIDKLFNRYKWPLDVHHITSCYAGGKKQQNAFYSKFQENQEIPIEIHALVYVPEYIITSICFVNSQVIEIQNQCPHCTLMLGKWTAEKSNNVLEALFINKDAPLISFYNLLKDQHSVASFYQKLNIPGQGDQFDVFVIKPKQKLVFQGITKAIYPEKQKDISTNQKQENQQQQQQQQQYKQQDFYKGKKSQQQNYTKNYQYNDNYNDDNEYQNNKYYNNKYKSNRGKGQYQDNQKYVVYYEKKD